MADESKKLEDVVTEMTVEEQRALARALREVESVIVERTYRRVRRQFFLLFTIVGILGAGLLVAVFVVAKAAVVEVAAGRIASDEEVKTDVLEHALGRLRPVEEAVSKAEALSLQVEMATRNLDLDTARASSQLLAELEEINAMVDQLRRDVQTALGPNSGAFTK